MQLFFFAASLWFPAEHKSLDKDSPPASVFALRATPRHVARTAKVAEKKYLDTPQALIYILSEITINFQKAFSWRNFYQVFLLISIIGIMFILPVCLPRWHVRILCDDGQWIAALDVPNTC